MRALTSSHIFNVVIYVCKEASPIFINKKGKIMKTMYIKLLASCCLVATISHAAENQGRPSYCAAAQGQVLRRHVSTIGTDKPAIFPYTDATLFKYGKHTESSYQKNTISHPAKPQPTHPHVPQELALLFAPAIENASAQRALPEIPAADNTAALFAQESAASQLATLEKDDTDGYASDASSVYDDSKHISATTLSGSRFAVLTQRGYGYAYSVAATLAAKKETVPGTGKRAKFHNKQAELNAGLSDLANASLEQADTILQYAAGQKPGVVDPQSLSAARDYFQKAELAAFAALNPAIQAAKAQAARVKAAQEQLAKEEAALKAAQEKLLTQVPTAKARAEKTDLVLSMLGAQLPEAPDFSTDLPSHEIVAAEMQARIAALQTKPTPAGGAASSAASASKLA